MHPFLAPSTLPAALPPFADLRPEHYAPAFEQGLAEQRAEVAAITANPASATFPNTIEALERSGRVLSRVSAAFFTLASADGTDWVRDLEAALAPRLAAHHDAIALDPALFDRIRTVWNARAALGAEERYLVERVELTHRLAGASLTEEAKARLRAINERLSELTTVFDANLVADSAALAVHLTDAAELAGLAEDDRAAAARAAAARGLDGWLVPLVLPTGHPYLASLEQREVRERIMTASLARGRRDGAHDNRPVLLEIVRLRAERAELLGFPTHAALVPADETARTPEAVSALLDRVTGPAVANAEAEAAALTARLRATGVVDDLRSWDWAFAAEQERRARYDVDLAAFRPYLEAERVLHDGVFWAANRLYGVDFTERGDLPGYHPDVRVFEVREGERLLGLLLLDLFARDTKRGGAWMTSLVDRSRLLGEEHAVVVTVLNVPRPGPGSPALLTLDTAETLFHEFGHALHGLFAEVTYPRLAGTNVPRDFVEFPSQVNELWLLWPEVVANFARHHETGEPIPAALVDRLRASRTFNEGFATAEYLAATLLDQAWHRLSAAEAAAITDVEAFEAAALARAGVALAAVPPRYTSTTFAHVFSGGYAAAYYAYIWSEVLDADTVAWFEEHGGLTRENGERFRRLLLQVGGSADPLQAYRDFRGRDARVEPLLERRGLTPTA